MEKKKPNKIQILFSRYASVENRGVSYTYQHSFNSKFTVKENVNDISCQNINVEYLAGYDIGVETSISNDNDQ